MKKLFCVILAVLMLTACATPGGTTPNDPAVSAGGAQTDPPEVLKEAPELHLLCTKDSFTALSGNYSWDYDLGNGERSGVIACGMHPLDEQIDHVTLTAGESEVRLKLVCTPDTITVRCWSADCLGDIEAPSESVPVEDGVIALLPGDYIYEVSAQWSSQEAFSGTASYCFRAEGHSHALAETEQTVEDPFIGYCGNTMTTVCLDSGEYSISAGDSVTLTDILINLRYDPQAVCRCLPEFTVDTEFGTGYGVNLAEGYVRCDDGQAPLTAEQAGTIREIINRLG